MESSVWAKPLMLVLSAQDRLDEEKKSRLEQSFGPIEFQGPSIPFDWSEYYADEMGKGLRRHFLGFRQLMRPEELVEWKFVAVEIEKEWSREGSRLYNLDTGYLDADKLVLASFKRGPCKIYMGRGVYADMLMVYSKGAFRPTEWAFSDFKAGVYDRSLLVIREKLKAGLRRERQAQ